MEAYLTSFRQDGEKFSSKGLAQLKPSWLEITGSAQFMFLRRARITFTIFAVCLVRTPMLPDSLGDVKLMPGSKLLVNAAGGSPQNQQTMIAEQH